MENSVTLEMIRDAREALKEFAAYVCLPNTENGLARFIEEYVLNAKGEKVD